MHGIIFYGLKEFVETEYGEEAWHEVLEEADLGRRIFVPVTDYPDEDLVAIVEAAAELTGEDAADLQYAFGRFVVPQLVDTYGVHVSGEWSGLDLVENVEEYIHEALRSKELSEFAPPGLGAERLDGDSVLVTYSSDRGLCDVARGILDGVADYYESDWDVSERACMHEGHSRCELLVRG